MATSEESTNTNTNTNAKPEEEPHRHGQPDQPQPKPKPQSSDDPQPEPPEPQPAVITADMLAKIPLDATLYSLKPHEAAFFKAQTGIQDDEELKRHVLEVQREAWDIYHYVCIRNFAFMNLRISGLRAYPDLLKLGKEKPDAIFLEFACCFGNDARKAIADGYPMQNVIASDIQPDFWRLGHKLFRTTPETFPVPFVPGDVFDPNHIEPIVPPLSGPTPTPRPDLQSLTSLNPLRGHVSAIHVSAFFHLFNREDQLHAARALASLLSPEPGSFIFGTNGAQPSGKEGPREVVNPRGQTVFLQSPETWREMWEEEVFEKGTVEVWCESAEFERTGLKLPKGIIGNDKVYRMEWCVRRK